MSQHAAAVHTDENKTILGFWIYLMTDCVLFATLFATYAVLYKGTNGGPDGAGIFSMPYVLTQTLILLTSSFTSGLAILAAHNRQMPRVLAWLGMTFVLGAAFLGLEINEFSKLIAEGYSWRHSAFLSVFFTLVGTHGLHITAGLLWLVVLARQLISQGLTPSSLKRLTLFSLFWHFLDIVWIFIFTIVYLMGAS